MEEQHYYDIVAQELQEKHLRPGLWTRAVAETGSEDAPARALYIRLRVSELVQQAQADATHAQTEAPPREAANQPRISAPLKITKGLLAVLWMLVILLLCVPGIAALCDSDSTGEAVGGAFLVGIGICFLWGFFIRPFRAGLRGD